MLLQRSAVSANARDRAVPCPVNYLFKASGIRNQGAVTGSDPYQGQRGTSIPADQVSVYQALPALLQGGPGIKALVLDSAWRSATHH